MNLRHLENKTEELVNSFSTMRTKLLLDSFAKDDSEEIKEIHKQIDDLEHGLEETEFLALLLKYLKSVELDRQQLRLENDILRDELNYISDKIIIVDQNVISDDHEEQQRQDRFDNEIRTLNELLEKDVEFSEADVSTLMRVEEVINVSSDNIAQEIPMRTKVAATYFTKYLNEYNFDVAVPTCQRFIKDMESNKHADRLEVAAMLEIQAMAYRNDLQFFDAANLLKKTLTIYDEMLEVDNPLILITLKNLIQIYGMMDPYADEQNLTNPLLNRAITSENQNNFDAAIKLYRQILEIYEQPLNNVSEYWSSAGKRLADGSLQQEQSKKAKNVKTLTNQQNNNRGGGKKCIFPCYCEFCESIMIEKRAKMQAEFVLAGFPEMPFTDCSDDFTAVCKLGRYFNVNIKRKDIILCYRAGLGNGTILPRTLFVTFRLQAIRDAIYYAYMKTVNLDAHNLKVKDIFPSTTSTDRIFISERLTKPDRELYRRCAYLKKSKIIDRYFTQYGRVYIQRKTNDESELATDELIKMFEQSHKERY